MGYHAFTPAPPLEVLIESIWDWEMEEPCARRLERILPVPTAGLIINLAEDQTRVYSDDADRRCSYGSGSVFSGLYTRSFLIDTDEQQRVMGIVFRPGGASPFFRERMDLFSDRDVDLEDLDSAGARHLRQRLLEAAGPEQRLALLEDWLRRRMTQSQPRPVVARALDTLHRSPQTARIGHLIADSGISPRRFGVHFRQYVGLSPKRYARLLRFRAVLDDVHQRREVDWARIAADCAFCDQAHLTHEFRAFSGMTPSAYVAQKGPYVNHVPLE